MFKCDGPETLYTSCTRVLPRSFKIFSFSQNESLMTDATYFQYYGVVRKFLTMTTFKCMFVSFQNEMLLMQQIFDIL